MGNLDGEAFGDGSEVAGTIRRLASDRKSDGLHFAWLEAMRQNSVRSMPNDDDFGNIRRINDMLVTGNAAVRIIPIGAEPGPDCDDAFNNAGLANLPHPFIAEFKGGDKHNSDGWVEWSEPVWFDWCPDANLANTRPILLPPDLVDLEVGTTASWTTLRHLIDGRGVARWPYDYRFVTLVVRVPRDVRDRERELTPKAVVGVEAVVPPVVVAPVVPDVPVVREAPGIAAEAPRPEIAAEPEIEVKPERIKRPRKPARKKKQMMPNSFDLKALKARLGN